MSKFGTEFAPQGAPALPLWIGGHAFLTVTEAFFDVRAADGKVLRRVPLCGAAEVATAVDNAQAAVPAWRALEASARAAAFVALHDLLARYRGHLARLLVEEAGLSEAAADAEMGRALAAVSGILPKPAGCGGDVVAVLNDQSAPIAEPLACTAEALLAGNVVLLKPSPKAPSALLALAELFTRAGFPAGTVNLVQGDEAAVRALADNTQITAIACVAEDAVCHAVSGMLSGAGKVLVAGRGDATLAHWRTRLGIV